MSPNLKAVLIALVAFGVFATHDVVIKVLGEQYSPIQLVFFSVLLSFPIASLSLMRDSKPGTLLPVHPWWVAMRTVAVLVTGLCAFYAFSVLPLAQTYAILFAAPLLITVLSIPVLGEKVGVPRWLAVAVGLIGVIVVLRPGSAALSWAHLAALGAAVGGAFSSIVVRKIGAEERPIVLMLYPLVLNFIVLGAALALVYKPMPIQDFGLMAVVSLLAWVASRLIITAYREGEAAIVAPMQYSQILWATAYGAFIFDERIDLATAIGAAIVIGSGLFIVMRESNSGNSEHTPVLRTRSRIATPSTLRISGLMSSGRHRDKLKSGDKTPQV